MPAPIRRAKTSSTFCFGVRVLWNVLLTVDKVTMQVLCYAPGTIRRPKIISNADTSWPLLLVFCQHD